MLYAKSLAAEYSAHKKSLSCQRSRGFFIAAVFLPKLLKYTIGKRFLKVKIMFTGQQLYQQTHQLPALEKQRLAELLLSDLDLPDSNCDKVWANEVQQRWQAYQADELATVRCTVGMEKYQ